MARLQTAPINERGGADAAANFDVQVSVIYRYGSLLMAGKGEKRNEKYGFYRHDGSAADGDVMPSSNSANVAADKFLLSRY